MKKLVLIGKIILFLSIIWFIGCLCSCESNVKKKDTKYFHDGGQFNIIEVDNCEYLMWGADHKTMTHKGNCKFCKHR